MNKYLLLSLSLLFIYACNNSKTKEEFTLDLSGKVFQNNFSFDDISNTWKELGSCFLDELTFDSSGNFIFTSTMADLTDKCAGDSSCDELIYKGQYSINGNITVLRFKQGYQYKGIVYLQDMVLTDSSKPLTENIDFYKKADLPTNLIVKVGNKGGKPFIQYTTFFKGILLEVK